jgi:hypothetical protein
LYIWYSGTIVPVPPLLPLYTNQDLKVEFHALKIETDLHFFTLVHVQDHLHHASRLPLSFNLAGDSPDKPTPPYDPCSKFHIRVVPADLEGKCWDSKPLPTSFLLKKSLKPAESASVDLQLPPLRLLPYSISFLQHTYPPWPRTATPPARRQMSRTKTSLLWNTSMSKQISKSVSFSLTWKV